MKFSDMTHDEMLERFRIVTQESNGLRQQLEGWKKVAQESEKVRDLALANQEVAILGRVRAERSLDSMRAEAVMRQREHASMLADSGSVRALAERVAEKANERAANMAVELAAMTLSRDQARQEADRIRRQVAAVIDAVAAHLCPPNGQCVMEGEGRCIKCWIEWAWQQAKEAK
jgi:hypothetical protein